MRCPAADPPDSAAAPAPSRARSPQRRTCGTARPATRRSGQAHGNTALHPLCLAPAAFLPARVRHPRAPPADRPSATRLITPAIPSTATNLREMLEDRWGLTAPSTSHGPRSRTCRWHTISCAPHHPRPQVVPPQTTPSTDTRGPLRHPTTRPHHPQPDAGPKHEHAGGTPLPAHRTTTDPRRPHTAQSPTGARGPARQATVRPHHPRPQVGPKHEHAGSAPHHCRPRPTGHNHPSTDT